MLRNDLPYDLSAKVIHTSYVTDHSTNVHWVMEFLAAVSRISELLALKSAYSKEILIFCKQK